MTACVAGGEGAQRVSLRKMMKAVRCVRRRCMCCVRSSVEVVVATVATTTMRATSSAPVTASVWCSHGDEACSGGRVMSGGRSGGPKDEDTKMMAAAATPASPCQA
ncbi:hypothetical protein PVAP13_5KG198900 [Panicum virgatum]|uniref:Uncharacterized protein n=1 Tax=Panicum virgatum TaxID=38727 RepID=A0A8T0SJI7_PANVG|nr:hypothetical protein PVAP13_5KG198900 [Panicum virgatum]